MIKECRRSTLVIFKKYRIELLMLCTHIYWFLPPKSGTNYGVVWLNLITPLLRGWWWGGGVQPNVYRLRKKVIRLITKINLFIPEKQCIINWNKLLLGVKTYIIIISEARVATKLRRTEQQLTRIYRQKEVPVLFTKSSTKLKKLWHSRSSIFGVLWNANVVPFIVNQF